MLCTAFMPQQAFAALVKGLPEVRASEAMQVQASGRVLAECGGVRPKLKPNWPIWSLLWAAAGSRWGFATLAAKQRSHTSKTRQGQPVLGVSEPCMHFMALCSNGSLDALGHDWAAIGPKTLPVAKLQFSPKDPSLGPNEHASY